MITKGTGDLLKADAEALVNTVNTVGVMGKGVALQFKLAFPDLFIQYKKACKNGEVIPGKMYVYHVQGVDKPSVIINFPTKRHWKGKSQLQDIRDGLVDLVGVIKELNIKSIAIPPLGCGSGGLKWDDVRPIIINELSKLTDVNVIVFPPTPSYNPSNPIVRTVKPKLTWIKSNIIRIFEKYSVFDYTLTNIEAQKLLYFLQESGEDLKLSFVKNRYGPYAANLGHLLIDLEGHYTEGHSTGDNNPKNYIKVLPSVHDEVDLFIKNHRDFHPESEERMNNVLRLIRGFETPYGLELLATVHWICTKNKIKPLTLDELINAVQSWNEHKKTTMKPKHIEVAYKRLKQSGWLPVEN